MWPDLGSGQESHMVWPVMPDCTGLTGNWVVITLSIVGIKYIESRPDQGPFPDLTTREDTPSQNIVESQHLWNFVTSTDKVGWNFHVVTLANANPPLVVFVENLYYFYEISSVISMPTGSLCLGTHNYKMLHWRPMWGPVWCYIGFMLWNMVDFCWKKNRNKNL